MRYEAVTLNDGSRFTFDRDEPLREGEQFLQFTMLYEVERVLPGHDDIEAVLEVKHPGGPAQGAN